MSTEITTLARQLLDEETDGLEELRIHWFVDDEAAHDDERIEELYEEFGADFEQVEAALSQAYGPPFRVGNDDDDAIPLSGVFRFALWHVDNQSLFVAIAHEDREIPIMFMLGTTSE